ncbi:MAG TPA: O-antigen ligase family protein [Vicinamibacterales bacterium]|nr:O-antigen ligase family protein [Vicinamibacterales bacterium]
MPVPRAWTDRALVGSWTVPVSVMLVAAVSPFERPLPGAVFGFTLTTVELSIVLALLAGGVAAMREPATSRWLTPITLPLLALFVCAMVSSAAAPEFRGNAFKFVGRLAAASLIFILVVNAVTTWRLARQIVAVLLAAGAVVGAIAVLELAQVPVVLDTLRLFRPGFHVVGGQLRATSTLFYPTITSMYLEVVFALGLMWIASSRLAFTALIIIGAGIIATFTRAGLITMSLSLTCYAAAVYWTRRRWDREHTRVTALAAILIALVLVSRSPQMLVTRITNELSQDWYGASYQVPDTLALRSGSFNEVPVTLSNRGWITWQSAAEPVFALSYHWLTVDTEEVLLYDGLRTPFAQPVAPGDDVQLQARVRAPGYPGSYVLVWDVVQEHRTWLSLEGVYPGRTLVTVHGDAVTPPLPTRGRMPSGTMRMPRSVLWSTALDLSRARPWLGIGPDNFRLVYGPRVGLTSWDTRVHTNNTYLEVLVGTGLIGFAAMLWLLIAAAWSTIGRFAAANADTVRLVAATTAAGLAIAAHAMVDSFLTFTSTYVVFAIAAGLHYSHAHRV